MLPLVGFAAFVIVVSVAGAVWRTRPQFASPRGETRFAFFVLVLAVTGVMASGPHLGPAVIGLAPVAALAGWMLGRALQGTLRFWSDPDTGQVKFAGGKAYFVILAVSALSRVFLRYLLTGSIASHTDPTGVVPQALMVVAGALLFMDAGLYFARAQAIAAAAGERIRLRWLSMSRQA
jgi:hypothetical protein